MNFPFFTFGGLFYRTDKYSYAGWRIQKFLWTNRCRLLDPWQIRRASGSFDVCKHRLEEFVRAWEIPSPPKKAVVFLRGYFQTPYAFSALEKELSADFEILHFSAPLTRRKPEEIVEALKEYLNARPDIGELNFVATGVGGEVLRMLLAADAALAGKTARSLFVAAPAKGYGCLESKKDSKFFKFFFGACFDLLVPSRAAGTVPPMKGEFAELFGGKDAEKGFLPWLKGDNDGVLRTDEAQLPNAKESYLAADEWHWSLLRGKRTVGMIAHFLRNGRFGTGKRIRKEPVVTTF